MASVLYPHNSLKNSKKAQGHQIQNMLQKVSNILSHLLQDLQIIYKSNGVNYEIGHFHYTLIRILTPFELLTQFGLANNSNIINLNEVSSNYAQRNNHINSKSQFIAQSENQFSGQQGNLNLIPKQYSNSKPQKLKPKPTKANDKLQIAKPKRDITKPVLSQEIENQIAEWALSKLKQNLWVRRIDLAEKAIKLSTVKDFKASSGWIKNFFIRHPEVLQAMRKTNQATKGKKKCEADSSQCEEELQKMLKAEDYSQLVEEESKDEKDELSQQNSKKKHKAIKKYEKQLESEGKFESSQMDPQMNSINYSNNMSFQYKQSNRSHNERPSMNRMKYNFF